MSHAPRAFTLIETIVVIAMTTGIFIVLGTVLQYFYRTNAYTLEQSTAVESARRSINDAMNSLREASYASDGSYPISAAATSSIKFYANINDTPSVEQVSYSLTAGTFYRSVVTPAGNPPSYSGGSTATSTIATYVVNGTSTPIFTYFDDTGAMLPSPTDVSRIASVEVSVIVDVNTARAPVAFTLSAGATLRNLKNQK